MSELTLKLHQPIPREEAHGTRWLWLEDAMPLLGITDVGTLRRRAAKDWHGRCLARQAKRATGQMAWQVSELADPRLAAASAAGPAPDDKLAEIVARLSDKQRAAFARDQRIYNGWLEALKAGDVIDLKEKHVTPRYIAKLHAEGITEGVSRGTLYRMKLAVARGGGIIGLLDKRWTVTPVDTTAIDDKFTEALKRSWLTQHKRSKRLAAELAAQDAGIEFTDAVYKAAQRILNAIPLETRVLFREGAKAFTNKIETHIDRDWSQIPSNHMWCADHHRLDTFVRYIDPQTGEEKHARPWLHAWQDLRSRKIVGYKLFVGHDPNSNVIVSVLTGSIAACYRPKIVLLDNGKDFDSRVVTGITKTQRRRLGRQSERPTLPEGERIAVGGVLSMLEVQVKHAWPYHGQSKPIERWFGTVADQFSKLWDGYCGRDTLNKPEWLAKRLRDGIRIPDFNDVAAAFDDYVRGFNATPSMAADNRGRSPDQVWAENVTPDPVLVEILDFTRLTRVTARVRQKAVVRIPGLDASYGRGEQQLINRIGQDVVVAYDPQHMETAWLCDPKSGAAICRIGARRDMHPDATEQDLRHGVAVKKAVKRRSREYMEDRPRRGLDVVELARLAAAKRINRDQERRLATGTDDKTLLAGHPIPINSVSSAIAAAAPARIEQPSTSLRITPPADALDAPALNSLSTYRRRSEQEDDQ